MIETKTVFECDACTKTQEDPSYDNKKNWWKLESAGSSYEKPVRLLCHECADFIFNTIGNLKQGHLTKDGAEDNTTRLGVYR